MASLVIHRTCLYTAGKGPIERSQLHTHSLHVLMKEYRKRSTLNYYAHMHACMHTPMCTHTHMHTHTHTHSLLRPSHTALIVDIWALCVITVEKAPKVSDE